jgi:hypothetical protein
MKLNFKVFQDILKDKTTGVVAYSQARVYLLVSVVAMLTALTVLFIKSFKPGLNISTDVIKQIIDAIQWMILVFSSYALGTKAIDGIKTIMGKAPLIQKIENPCVQTTSDSTITQIETAVKQVL